MKTSNLLLTLALSLCLTSGAAFAQDAVQPQKRNLLSIFRKKPQPQAPAQAQVQAPPQVPQQQAAPAKRGLRLPQFPRLDVSKVRLPQMNLPKVSMPRLSMPKWNLPKVSLPKFKRSGNKQTAEIGEGMQEYQDAIPTRDGNGYHAIITDKNVKFYELGPSQPFGPDGYLDRGDRVTLRSNDRSWAQVTLADKRTGYIGLDQVRFAAQSEVPQERVMRDPSALAQSSATELGPLEDYAPPTLPEGVSALQSPEVQFNPLLDPLNPDEEGLPIVEPPIDSQGVVLDPPSPANRAPFLEDPLLGNVPSVEEELRAIREANEAANAEPDADSGESSEEN